MKKFLFTGIIAILASCSQNSYTINGNVESKELEGKIIYKIASNFTEDWSIVPQKDSAIIRNGKYVFKGEAAGPDYCNIYLPAENNGNMGDAIIYRTIVLEKGNINVNTSVNNKTTVSGTPMNDDFQRFENKCRPLHEKLSDVYAKLEKLENEKLQPQGEKEKLEAEFRQCRRMLDSLDYDFVKENINNPATWYMKLYNTSITTNTVEKKKELIAGADEFTKNLPIYKGIVKRIATLERTAVGQPYVDIKMQNTEGEIIALSDYIGKGKYVLVDMWASWCGPCRAEMPNVINAYHKYKDKGLEIVGISLDSKKESWIKAIDELKIPWPQMSDLKSWKSEGAKAYAVSGIPHTILIDKEGTIIARGIRGEELHKKLEELLGK